MTNLKKNPKIRVYSTKQHVKNRKHERCFPAKVMEAVALDTALIGPALCGLRDPQPQLQDGSGSRREQIDRTNRRRHLE